MADISFTCPHCKQHLEAPPEMAGEQLSCPTCKKGLKIPTTVPVKLTAQPKPMGGKILAGLVGGFILSMLAANVTSVVFGDPTAKEQGAGVTAVSGFVFFGLWAGSVYISIKADRAAKAWRKLLITSACLSFSLPLAGMLMAGKAAYHYETKGRHLESAAMAGAGGIAAIALGIMGFFLGAIFLTIGLLVGRDNKKTG
jgi:hypothetical protein